MYVTVVKITIVGIVLAIVKWLFFSKTSKNPLEKDCRRDPEPLVREKQARASVYKKKFTPEQVPKDLDAIVIGSGIGGLSAAALLAKTGKKVLVLEQLNKAGGCTHTFKKMGVEFDVGIHYIGNMMGQSIMRTLVDQITEGQLQWSPLEDSFDVVVIGESPNERRYEIGSGANKMRKLKEYFPGETEAIDKFFSVMKTSSNNYFYFIAVLRFLPRFIARIVIKLGLLNFMAWTKLANTTLEEYLRDLTQNQELRAVLGYCFGDYGTLPSKACIGVHAFLWRHFYNKVAYPVGGASEIAMQVIPVIEKPGGKVLVKADVKKIIIKNGQAIGVTVMHGKSEIPLYAPAILSNAGVHNTFKKLLPPEVAEKCSLTSMLSKIDHAVGGISVFVGLNGTKEELGLSAQNIWAFTGNDLDKISREYLNKTSKEAEESSVPLMFQSFPSAKDPSFETRFPGKSTMAIVSLANYKWFEEWRNEICEKRSDPYNEFKNIIGEILVHQTLKLFPHLKDKIIDVIVGSPLTNDHYIASPRGEMYGLDHTTNRFGAEAVSELRPDTEIPGLYLTGQDTFSCGFGGALFGGLLCASSVLNRTLIKDLMILHRQLKNSKKSV